MSIKGLKLRVFLTTAPMLTMMLLNEYSIDSKIYSQ